MSDVNKNLGHATAYGYAKSKGYTGTEDDFATLMASYADVAEQARESAEDSEAWAVGERDSVPVPDTDAQYHNNSKYYAEQASTSAGESSDSAEASGASALVSEGHATGSQGGEPVEEGSPYYHNNAMYYSKMSSQSADDADGYKRDAETAKTNAETAETNAETAEGNAEAWAVGTKDSVPVPDTDPQYQNNAKYYAEQAQDAADASAAMTGLANQFDSTTAYAIGDYVLYDGTLYQFTASHPAGAWTGTDAVATVMSNGVSDLKSHLSYLSQDIGTQGGENIFDDSLLVTSDIKNTNYHEYTGTASSFTLAFGNNAIPVDGKQNTRYKLFLKAKSSESGTGTGVQFKYVYSDSSEEVCLSIPNTTTSVTEFTSDVSANAKTVTGIKITYGSLGGHVWSLSDIMLTSDITSTVFVPYLTAKDRTARSDIQNIEESLSNIDEINQEVCGVLSPKWVAADVDITTSGWVYNYRVVGVNAKRIAPAEGHPIKLKQGDVIGLTSYTDARYYLGWRIGNTYYTAGAWLTADTVAPQTAEYCMTIAHLDNRNIASISELSSLFKYSVSTLSDEISKLESVAGTGPDNGYSYFGEKISINEFKFSSENVDVSIGQGQDCVVYDHYALGFSADNGTCKVTDLDTNATVTTFQMPSVGNVTPHFNSAVFGDTMTGQSIPLLYANVNLPYSESPGLCAVYQITHSGNNWSATLVQTIDISFVGDAEWGTITRYDAVGFAVFNGKLYVIGASSGKNKTHVCSFAIPSHANDVTLTRTDIIDSFDIVYMSVIQGCMVNGSKLYILDGLGTVNGGIASLYVVDLIKEDLVSFVDLSLVFTGEPEFIFVYDGKIIFGGFKIIVLRV